MTDNNTHEFDRRSFLKATGAVSGAAAFSGVSAASDDEDCGCSGTDAADGDQIVLGIADVSRTATVASEMDSAASEYDLPEGAEVVRTNETLGHVVVDVSDTISTFDVETAVSTMESNDDVKFAENNDPIFDVDPIAADELETADATSASVQSAPDDTKFSEQYAPQQVRADLAWEKTLGGNDDVTIAVVDQGTKYDHPDLEDRFGDVKGKDFAGGDDDPYPEDLQNEIHGTHVSGICAATTGNGTGVAGVSNANLLACRALGNRGGRPSDIADAVQWATDQGADIINMSLGGPSERQSMRDAINYAVNNGALPLASAGNSCERGVGYPAGYDNCVAVSAVDSDQYLASFSQYGPNVDVTGPGVDVLSTWPNETDDYGIYNKISGTSMSCPAVAGVAALGKAENPEMSPTELRQLLKESAVDIGLDEEEQGAGRADAANIVEMARDDAGAPNATLTTNIDDPHVGETVVLDASASGDEAGRLTSYEWEFGDGTTASGPKQHYTYDDAGAKTVTLTVTDDDGESASATKELSVQSGRPGEREATEEFSGSIDSGGNRESFSYDFQFDPSALNVTFDGDSDFVWAAVHDGNVFTPCEGDVDVPDYKLVPSEPVRLVVLSREPRGGGQAPTGSFSLTLTESGFGEGGGSEPDPNEPPTAAFSLSADTVTVGEELTLDAGDATDPDGTIETYAWSLGDGTELNGETGTHAYTSDGDYTVTLTVTDDGGARDQATSTVQVTPEDDPNESPTAAFSLDSTDLEVGDAVTADASASSDADGSIAAYDWTFGDGRTASGETASHSYDVAGDYTVTLTVTDGEGASDSATRSLSVTEPDDPENPGECGDAVERSSTSGSLTGWWDSESYAVETLLDDPCSMDISLSGPSGADFDLYLTLDGRTPATDDYDRQSIDADSEESITVEDLDASSEFGLLVDSYSGSGDYTLEFVERGTGDGGDVNEGPTARIAVDSDTVTVGEAITFSAAESTDPDGSIAAYDWAFGDGRVASGDLAEYAFESAGTYEVALTVTDDAGATDTARATVTVESDDGGECGAETATATAQGRLSGWWDSASYAWEPSLDQPCQVTLSITGSPGADFDLYVATGRAPTTGDFDKRSITPGSDEQVVLDDVEGTTAMNILVDSYSGGGPFTLTVEEIGR